MTLMKFRNELPSLFDEFFNSEFLPRRSSALPPVNISEEDGRYMVELASPGFGKDDFKVEVDDNVLTISSEREFNKRDFARQEFEFRSFSRSFTLPDAVDREKIDAKYENGVLAVAIPKTKHVDASKRTIEIT